jgi:hypothetical protein
VSACACAIIPTPNSQVASHRLTPTPKPEFRLCIPRFPFFVINKTESIDAL